MPVNTNVAKNHIPSEPIQTAETKPQPSALSLHGKITVTDNQVTNQSTERSSSENSKTMKLCSSSSSDSSNSSKTTTWGQVKSVSPKKRKNTSKCQTSEHSPKSSPIKNKNEKAMTSWKNMSPTKSNSSDLEQSNHSTQSNEYANKILRYSNNTIYLSDSASSNSDINPGQHENHLQKQSENQEHSNEIQVTSRSPEKNCVSKNGSPSKKLCNCSGNCKCQHWNNQNALINSNTSLSENGNGSPKKEKGGVNGSPDDVCDNDYYYEDDFTVQFDTNLREVSMTPMNSDQNTTILDFSNMVTGSYLCFHNGGSSKVSFNNSKASLNVSINNLHISNIINNQGGTLQYDSEFSGNSGSHNSTMEMSSSDKDMLDSSDGIELIDGPLFTPTPSHIVSTDSLDNSSHEVMNGEMSGSNGSGETNLNVNCCPRKEEYFLSFDGSHSRVSGSDTDISMSFTSHDSYQGHLGQCGASVTSHDSGQQKIGEELDDLSNSEGQEESDSFHVCFNKLSLKHKGSQYAGRENLSSKFIQKLIPLKEIVAETADSCEEEYSRTSTTLTAGSKDLSSTSPQVLPKKEIAKHFGQPVRKFKEHSSRKSEHMFLVGIGKPIEILNKTGVHSHTLPRVKKLVSWKQLKHFKQAEKTKCISLPELSTATSWQNMSALKCKQLSDFCDSFHGKRHSTSLFEFYQRMKSESNPVSPETMKNLEQFLLPNFVGQKCKTVDSCESSQSSHECAHCQCRQNICAEIRDSGLKSYTNKRISDWLKMECSTSSKDLQRPHFLACQIEHVTDCFNKETLVSPQTVALWCGTKTVCSQFPPVTKDCSIQTLQNSKESFQFNGIVKKDQALQTSDFEEEEIVSILSDNFDEFGFLKSNEDSAKELLSCPEISFERDLNKKTRRSKFANGYWSKIDGPASHSDKSYQQEITYIGRSRSVGGKGRKSISPARRMGISKHYSYQYLPDIAFLSSSVTLDKDESKDSLFDAVKIELDVPVVIATKTELEQLNIYQQKANPCHRHHHRPTCCTGNKSKNKSSEHETGSSSSGISSWSGSSSTDSGSCDCWSRSVESPQNDIERLIFYPPHTVKFKENIDCCDSKKRAHSLPSKLSECTSNAVKMEKYANENNPHSENGSNGQCRISQKWISGNKNPEPGFSENLYALEEDHTPVACPEQPCCHTYYCHGFQNSDESQSMKCKKCGLLVNEKEFTESDFYRAMQEDKIIIVGNNCYRGIQVVGMDSVSSSESSVPNNDRKPLKSCLRKKNHAVNLKSRSLSAADATALNFEDIEKIRNHRHSYGCDEVYIVADKHLKSRSLSAADATALNFEDIEKIRNHRHSYGCDEVYIVADKHGQLMMYQADDSAEPVMFYLGKDGECHMTEGHRNHMENFGSLANFNIQATDSIHGSDSLTEKEGSSGKRKSVSFASEVSFQSISPMVPSKKLVRDMQVESGLGKQVVSGDNAGIDKTVSLETGKYIVEEAEADETEEGQVPRLATATRQQEEQVFSSSSSESAPDKFCVNVDTNDNLWLEDVAQEKIGLLLSVKKAAELLVAHFAKSADAFDKLRLGNTSDCPELGDIVLTSVCTSLTHVLEDGLKQHLTGFQMFGRVQITVWKVVEASVEIVPQTRSLCDLVCKVKQTMYLTTHQQKFDAFIFGLLNLRLLDFWMQYIRQKEDQLAKFYSSGAILVHANNALRKQYDDVIKVGQCLAVLPFHLEIEFIRERALNDSKLKTRDLVVSADVRATVAATEMKCGTPLSESASSNSSSSKEASSVLEITASKAVSWLTNVALPKIKSLSESDFTYSKSFDSSCQITDSDNIVCNTSESFSCQGDVKDLREHGNEAGRFKQLFEIYQKIYFDARVSKIDCDPIISPSTSLRSSQDSQTGFTSFFTTMAARLGENPVNQSMSVTQAMTNSASSLVSRLFGSSKHVNKKDLTEYNFYEEPEVKNVVEVESADTEVKQTLDKVPTVGNETIETCVKDCEDISLGDKRLDSTTEGTRTTHVSFDIVYLFDKLLLPSTKIEKVDSKPVSRIPVPNNRWSWSFGITKPVITSPVKLPKTNTDANQKVNNHKNKPVAKREPTHLSKAEQHCPKKSVQQIDKSKGVKSVKNEKSKFVAPPKPPRALSSSRVGTKKTCSV